MIRIGEEGWKVVKSWAISRVEVRPPGVKGTETSEQRRTATRPPRASRREEDPQVHLSDHSYCAGLSDADELRRHLCAEGLRRCIDQAGRRSSVNDGARWIERIMLTNFPQAVQIVDWHHASGRLWTVAQALHGEGSQQSKSGWENVSMICGRGRAGRSWATCAPST